MFQGDQIQNQTTICINRHCWFTYPCIKRTLWQGNSISKHYVNTADQTVRSVLIARTTILQQQTVASGPKIATLTFQWVSSMEQKWPTDPIGLCILVFVLNKIKETAPEIEFGLYRDNGLGIHRELHNIGQAIKISSQNCEEHLKWVFLKQLQKYWHLNNT